MRHPDMAVRCGLHTARLVCKALYCTVLYCTRRSDVRHDERRKFGDNYIFYSSTGEGGGRGGVDLFKDHEVYFYLLRLFIGIKKPCYLLLFLNL